MYSTALKNYSFRFLLVLVLVTSFSCGTSAQRKENKKSQTWLQQHNEAAKNTVLLNNQAGIVPLKNLEQKMASVSFKVEHTAPFDSLLNKYTAVTAFPAASYTQAGGLKNLQDDLASFQTVIVQASVSAMAEKQNLDFLLNLERQKQLVVVLFGKAESLAFADALKAPIIWSEKESAGAASFAAQLVFGGVGTSETLSKDYSAKFRKGEGFKTAPIRLKYSVPEEVGVKTSELQESIDALVAEAIKEQATPGAVVLVAKSGKVIFQKAYGAHTYDNTQPTHITDIFDVASVTKISATTMAVMNLYDQRKVALDSSFSFYVPSARNTNKAGIKIRKLLLHQSGLPAGVHLPLQPQDVSPVPTGKYTVKASDSAYLRKDYFQEVIWPRMLNAKMGPKDKYVYADVSMYYLKEVVENQAKTSLDTFVAETFYRPLGMQTAGFLPLNRFPQSRIVPTEFDASFRKALLRGYVHDGGAARMGGVSGHAGLFATANDLAILYQMLLNGGTYGGEKYLNPETVQLFTTKQSPLSRRGLGFDRWDPDTTQQYPAKFATPETYGHTGYTGTCVWVDPKNELVYVFLSNRVHPKVSNKLISLKTRQRILDAIYTALSKGDKASALNK
ncbi:serine hydrolase domain-containing protein [Rufibacter sediminis]|uniref:Serine hydrolase n=1 Tax=Rufibacter sediminis TaxID=2762756 RepID=A0ABR6VWR7_9BACT|nr:serine hydrolase [Rufibacter sediminis]MBC3541622.1 serine hydrolase [Rufibacter sediminis]